MLVFCMSFIGNQLPEDAGLLWYDTVIGIHLLQDASSLCYDSHC